MGLVPSQIFFSVGGICTGTSNTGTVALNSTVQLDDYKQEHIIVVHVALNSTVQLDEYVQDI